MHYDTRPAGRADAEERYLLAANAAATEASEGDYADEEDDEPLEFGPSDADEDTLDALGACEDTEFHCALGEPLCIPIEQRCDGTEQCEDGADEADCKRNTFGPAFFATSTTEAYRGASDDAHANTRFETYIVDNILLLPRTPWASANGGCSAGSSYSALTASSSATLPPVGSHNMLIYL